MTLRTQAKKEKLDAPVFVKMRNFCSSKDKINRVKGDLWNVENTVQIVCKMRS